MRIPVNLTFFIDDCHVSAIVVPRNGTNQVSIMTSDKKSPRDAGDRDSITKTLMKELCKDVRDWTQKKEFENYTIDDCKIVLSPAWYLSRTSTITKSSLKPTVFTLDMILEAAADNLPKEPAIFGSKSDLLLIEQEVSHIYLNGYPVEKTEIHKATELKAAVYYCYMNKKFNDALTEIIRTTFTSIGKIDFHSITKVSLANSKKILNEQKDSETLKSGNLVVINFCSYITEVIFMHTETNMHIISLPIGFKETLHAVTGKDSDEHTVSESLLDMFLENKLKPEARNVVVELLNRSGKDWSNMVMQGISQLPKSPDSMTKLFVYGIDKQQAEIAKMFTGTLPFNSQHDISVSLFSNIIALL